MEELYDSQGSRARGRCFVAEHVGRPDAHDSQRPRVTAGEGHGYGALPRGPAPGYASAGGGGGGGRPPPRLGGGSPRRAGGGGGGTRRAAPRPAPPPRRTPAA